MGRAHDWDRFPDVVLLEQTIPVNAELLTKFFSEGSHTPGAIGEEIFSQNHRYRYRFLAIKDVQGVEVGDMIVMIDVTTQVSNLYSTMRVIAFFTVFPGGKLFFLSRFFLVRFENHLTTAQQKIIDLEKTRTRMESEVKFYSVAQSVNDAMISSDSSGNINFWNPVAVILFGYQEEEVLGQPLTMIMPERYREAYLKGMERLQSGEEGLLIGKTIELSGLKKDGIEFSMDLSLAQWTAGNKIFFTGLIRDISDRKRAEEELKRNHDMQRVINSLLSFSLQDISLQEILERSLHLILSLPWLAFEAKGSIFLIEKKPEILILKSQQGLAEPLRIACAQIPFGKCLCGRAAIKGEIEFTDRIDERHDIYYKGMIPHGHYCVPILSSGKVLGVINLYLKEGHIRQQKEEDFLWAFSHTLAGVIIRERTEKALRSSEEQFKSLFNQAADCILLMDPSDPKDPVIVDANLAAQAMYGYAPGELIGKPISLLDEPETKKHIPERIKILLSGKHLTGEARHVRKDGSTFTVEMSARLIQLKGKSYIQAIDRDITERKRAEEAIRQSEEKYRSVLESIEEGYYEVDLAGNLTFFNDAMARINGYGRDEMMGLNNREYTDLENSKILYQTFNQVYNTRESSKGTQYEVIAKNGEKRILETSASLITDSSGEPVGFRGIARDVTELREAQKTLQETEDRYRDLVESSRDLMCTHDLRGQILWVNEEPVRILGYAKNDILKMNIQDLLVPERKGEFDEFLATIKSLGIANGLMTLQTAKGEKRIWEYHNTLRTEGVDEPIVRSISRDVTERIQAERETRETVRKLRKAMGGIIQAIALTVETRDPYTAGHQHRVSDLARAIAQEMGLSENQVDGLRMAGIVHDLGKIGIPAEILSKPTKLSDLEIELLKIHPQISYDILKDIDFPWPVAQIVFQHHERINGSGYPLGLSGEDNYLEARILAVADVVEAIASHRPYRPAKGIDMALRKFPSIKGFFMIQRWLRLVWSFLMKRDIN